MMSKADDKPGRSPGGQESDERQSNIVPLVPKPRRKAADRAADRPAGDGNGDGDDPGPSAA
jgi:hypothetical protein